MVYRFRDWEPGLECLETKELFVIGYELDRLGFTPDGIDLDSLASAQGEAYVSSLLGPVRVADVQKEFLSLYLLDIRQRLQAMSCRIGERAAKKSKTLDENTVPEAMEITPKKNHVVEVRQKTPLTAPHKPMSAGIDVIKLRDTYFARVPLFATHIDTPRRNTKLDAESDLASVLKEIEKHDIENPALTGQLRESIVNSLKQFVETLALSKPVSVASTPQKGPQTGIIFSPESGKYHCVFTLHGESFQTPFRSTEKEAVEDKKAFQSEMKRVRALVSSSKSNSGDHLIINTMRRFVKNMPSSQAGIHRLRDKYFSSIDVCGTQLSTPFRDTEVEVVLDKEVAMEVLQGSQSGGRDAMIAEIKNRWTLRN